MSRSHLLNWTSQLLIKEQSGLSPTRIGPVAESASRRQLCKGKLPVDCPLTASIFLVISTDTPSRIQN